MEKNVLICLRLHRHSSSAVDSEAELSILPSCQKVIVFDSWPSCHRSCGHRLGGRETGTHGERVPCVLIGRVTYTDGSIAWLVEWFIHRLFYSRIPEVSLVCEPITSFACLYRLVFIFIFLYLFIFKFRTRLAPWWKYLYWATRSQRHDCHFFFFRYWFFCIWLHISAWL